MPSKSAPTAISGIQTAAPPKVKSPRERSDMSDALNAEIQAKAIKPPTKMKDQPQITSKNRTSITYLSLFDSYTDCKLTALKKGKVLLQRYIKGTREAYSFRPFRVLLKSMFLMLIIVQSKSYLSTK